MLLAKTSRTIKLGDSPDDEKPTLKFFDELFEAMPKIQLGQASVQGEPKVELSDYDKAIQRGKDIIACVNASKCSCGCFRYREQRASLRWRKKIY